MVNVRLNTKSSNFGKILKLRFLGHFLTLNNTVFNFFQNSNFSYFLGINPEIYQYSKNEI